MATQTGTTYGGFWIRLLAYLVDTVILTCALLLIVFASAFLGEPGAYVAAGACLLGPLLYWSLMQASARQASFGKALLGLKVAHVSGNRISLVRSFGRELAKFLSALPLLIGFLIAAFTGRKQALHDLIASTTVVKEARGHLVAALVIGLFGWIAPIGIVMAVGVGLVAGMMGIFGGAMLEQAATQAKSARPAKISQAPRRAPAPAAPAAAAAPVAAPSSAAAGPAASGGDLDAIFGARLAGPTDAGTTRAGPAILKIDATFPTSFWIKTYLPQRKEFETGTVSVALKRIADASGAELYDPANRLESEFHQRVSLQSESAPEQRLAGIRSVNLKTGARAEKLQQIEGTLKLSIPLKTLTASFAGADLNKPQTVHGVEITLKQLKANEVGLGVKGGSDRIVGMGAFGADRKPVERRSWSQGGGSMSYTFSGPVARVDVSVAESLAERSFPFTLTRNSVAGAAPNPPPAQASAPATSPAPGAPAPTAGAAEATKPASNVAAAPPAKAPVPAPAAPAVKQPVAQAMVASAPAPASAPLSRPAKGQPPATTASESPAPDKPARLAAAAQEPPRKRPRRMAPDADARKCLEQSGNLEVIKCAEAYR